MQLLAPIQSVPHDHICCFGVFCFFRFCKTNFVFENQQQPSKRASAMLRFVLCERGFICLQKGTVIRKTKQSAAASWFLPGFWNSLQIYNKQRFVSKYVFFDSVRLTPIIEFGPVMLLYRRLFTICQCLRTINQRRYVDVLGFSNLKWI